MLWQFDNVGCSSVVYTVQVVKTYVILSNRVIRLGSISPKIVLIKYVIIKLKKKFILQLFLKM